MTNWFRKNFHLRSSSSSSSPVNRTCFNDLPDELLVLIFKCLPIQDRFRFRRVSNRWYRLCLIGIQELEYRNLFGGKKEKNSTLNWIQIDPLLVVNVDQDRKPKYNFSDPNRDRLILYLLKKFNKSLKRVDLKRRIYVANIDCAHIWTTLIHNCPNITSLRTTGHIISFNDLRLLLKVYGPQLEELRLFDVNFIDKHSTKVTKVVIKRCNPDRLRKLSIPIPCTKTLLVLCIKFPLLTGFNVRRSLEQDIPPYDPPLQLFPLANLKRLQCLTLSSNIEPQSAWVPIHDWKHSLINLEIRGKQIPKFESFFVFLKHLTALRSFKVELHSQAELDHICDNVHPRIESMKFYLHKSQYTQMPDISRFNRLQNLKVYVYFKLPNFLIHWDQDPEMLSVRSIVVRGFGTRSFQMLHLVFKLRSVFPAAENLKIEMTDPKVPPGF